MSKSARLFTNLLVFAFMSAGVVASPAVAQDKAKAKAEKGKASTTVILNNDKVRVTEVRYKPGDEGPNVARPYRVVRALSGGTLMRTYADGKKETSVWKTGEVRASGPDTPYIPKNVGKSDFVIYSVTFKQAK